MLSNRIFHPSQKTEQAPYLEKTDLKPYAHFILKGHRRTLQLFTIKKASPLFNYSQQKRLHHMKSFYKFCIQSAYSYL